MSGFTISKSGYAANITTLTELKKFGNRINSVLIVTHKGVFMKCTGKNLPKEVKKLFKQYMLNNDIDSFKLLAKETGIDYQTLLDHLTRPELFRVYELRALNEVLQFSSEDLLFLINWEKLNMEVSA